VLLGSDFLWDPVPSCAQTPCSDGTLDGNQREIIGTTEGDHPHNEYDDEDGIAEDFLALNELVYTNLDFFNEDVDGDNYLGVRADSGNNRLPFDSLSPISVTSLDTQNVQDIITQAIVVEPVLRMRDFRRYRDWLLAAEGVASFNQGSANHPKVQTDTGSLAHAIE